MTWSVKQADCIDFLAGLEPGSVDMVLGSPPYCDARTYGIDAVYGCQEWVDWMLRVTEAAVRACKGLVLWVCSGVQRELCYWPGCEGLQWEWWKRGNQLWRPCCWWKVDQNDGGTGIPGSGGRQWLRNDWEYVLAFKREGWLPWADPLVMGHPPVCDQVGGEMSNRMTDGRRANFATGDTTRRANGERRPRRKTMNVMPGHNGDGTLKANVRRPLPERVNPGNVLPGLVVKTRVGGGHMGNAMCSDNEAPFPEDLAEFFVRSFCPESGLVVDPFSGSGTTGAVSVRWKRNFAGCDIRQSQVDLTRRRIEGETPLMWV